MDWVTRHALQTYHLSPNLSVAKHSLTSEPYTLMSKHYSVEPGVQLRHDGSYKTDTPHAAIKLYEQHKKMANNIEVSWAELKAELGRTNVRYSKLIYMQYTLFQCGHFLACEVP